MLRIQRISIQGFKTFARKTEFVFDPGVTAIVGPNGSGKSNVADAVRWCLGEQSFSTLRSKKTADVIFAGSDKRPRLGMATVSLTLDNRDGELPLDFSEVEITRRAYRDGDNEYLINGQRVRLGDITQLLAPSGLGKRAYAVIGQGLIDQVLSLKPEERRSLFEEAAGITGYQAKRSTSLRRLDATQQNLDRVQDIVAELAPRIRYLKRQAERANEFTQVSTDLRKLLHTWYGFRWHQTLNQMAQNQRKAEQTRTRVAARKRRLDEIGGEIEALRAAQEEMRDRLQQRSDESVNLQRAADEISKRLAVARERERQLQKRAEELSRELSELHEQIRVQNESLSLLETELNDAAKRHEEARQRVVHLQGMHEKRVQTRRALEEGRAAALSRQQAIVSEVGTRRNRLQHVEERREQIRVEIRQREEQRAAAQSALEAAQERLGIVEGNAEAEERELQRLQGEIQRAEALMTEIVDGLNSAEAQQRAAHREHDRLLTRHEMLDRLRREGAGYGSGVRSILQAASEGQLEGVLGTVASRLQVPPHLERAIEAALGGAYQNVIVQNWDAAGRAIDMLKRTLRGRATFLPLDRIYTPEPIPAPQANGVLGNAAELVGYDSAVAAAVEQFLNRVWVVEDLSSARRALDQHRGRRPTVVTLDGEIVRPGGAVTGGNDGRHKDDSVIARERELRELPQAISEAESLLSRARVRFEQAADARTRLNEKIARLRQRSAESNDRLVSARRAVETVRLEVARESQQIEWVGELSQRNQNDLNELEASERRLRAELSELQDLLHEADEQLEESEGELSGADIDQLLQELAELRADAGEARAVVQSRQEAVTSRRALIDDLERQLTSRAERLQRGREELADLATEIEKMVIEEESIQGRFASVRSETEPARKQLAQVEAETREAEASERNLQQLLRDEESSLSEALLALQRSEDRLENLRREIGQDLGLAEMEQSADLPYQPPLPIEAIVSTLPRVSELPPGLDREVQETRARLRRLGNINPDAPKEYEEASGRHEFLIRESEDLEKAAADLRQVIRELDRRMEKELSATFEAVSKEFVGFFRLLFQGGTAQLTLTDPDDIIHSGVEIMARPPGKRPQSLDLLSGGERSLTACALIFAILRVSPTPFCILDEVDAALDEANVDRFREVLGTLGDQTQFILITHNRRTLEASSTIYGITMGDDGVSRVISLRLEGDEIVQESGEAFSTSAEEAGVSM